MQKLNPITMSLTGNNLIEASAGTGKTYTITSLYLRALLGLQKIDQCGQGLSVEQILVVTFTEAATEEIRDRVRGKLLEAKEAIFYLDCDDASKPKVDGLLLEIIEQLPDKQQAFERLDGAIKMMDEAAIFTIHGFCQRMLKHHAFESGSLFDNEFILDEQAYLLTAIKDFWRCTVYPLSGPLLELFLANWRAPEKLLAEVRPLLNKQASRIEPKVSLEVLEGNISEYQNLSSKVKSQWLESQVPALINDSNIAKNRKPAKVEYLEAFTNFCLSDEMEFTRGKDSWELWSVDAIKKAAGKKEPPKHDIFELFSRLAELKVAIKQQVKAYFKIAALEVVQRNLAQAKAKAQKLSPDDLLTKMAKALGKNSEGKNEQGAQLLAQSIAKQYPLAMIDEFQDTDPLQYAIFSRIYERNDTTLVMIGDPKQAIYGFRGADIFTYIGAKEAVDESRQYTLDTNWRSSSALIHGVNGLFTHAKSAFIYDDAIPFSEVAAADKVATNPLTIDDDNGAALQLMQLQSEKGEPVAKGVACGQLADFSANEIVNILSKAQNQQAMIGQRAVQAGDICILVRDRNEAQIMRDALTTRGVSSVFLSRQSVFETSVASDFYLLLHAIYQQNNDKAIRAALVTCFFNTSINDLWHLTQNEDSWQQILNDFAELNRLWLRFGVMAVLQYLLVEQDLASWWRQSEKFPERMLTDVRHLAELLQQKSMELDGVHRLLNWFQQQLLGIAGTDGGQEKTAQLRLEDDSNLVQIVTMHASKGLEYPIVFMPFACHYRPTKSAIFHDENKDLVIDFCDDEVNIASADKERLAEDLRLLYVALTRAVYRCYVGISNLKQGNAKKSILAGTSIGYLLLDDGDINDQIIAQKLKSLVDNLNSTKAGCAALTMVFSGEEQAPLEYVATENEQTNYHLPQFSGVIEYDWKVTSYSALSYGVPSVHVLPGSTDEGSADGAQLPVVDTSLQQNFDRFSFPKGANAGSCLHQILENLPFIELAQGIVDERGLQSVLDSLNHYGIDSDWQNPVIQWLADVAATPWSRSGIALGQLRPSDCLIEMEFFLRMSHISAGEINAILSEHLGRTVHDFDFMPVQGVLKGFIDLTVCFKGKYYVVDYKSNYLGDNSVHYLGEALETAMDSHHYHLQYLLYTLALHRFLRGRVKDYDYDTHIGGCYYLFVRGMSSLNHDFNGIYFSKPKRLVIEKLDDLFSGINDDKTEQAKLSGSAGTANKQITPEQLGLFGE